VDTWNRWRDRNPELRPDLSGADLRGRDLRRVNLIHANLIRANLSETRMEGALLEGAVLCGADLQGANLRSASLSEANLKHANLRGAQVARADFSQANLTGASLDGIDLSSATIPSVPPPSDGKAPVSDFPPLELMDTEPAGSEDPPLPDAPPRPSLLGRVRERLGLRYVTAAAAGAILTLALSWLMFRSVSRPPDSISENVASDAEETSAHPPVGLTLGSPAQAHPPAVPSDPTSLERAREAVAARLVGQFGIEAVDVQNGILTAETPAGPVPVEDYYAILMATCESLGRIGGAPASLKELRVMDRSHARGWTYKAPQRCDAVLGAPEMLTRLFIAANTTRYSGASGRP
jgi:hypothetical protein